MKRSVTLAVAAAFLISGALVGSASAVPPLTTMIQGGTYNTDTEDWVTNNPCFKLDLTSTWSGGQTPDNPLDSYLIIGVIGDQLSGGGSLKINNVPVVFDNVIPTGFGGEGMHTHDPMGMGGWVTDFAYVALPALDMWNETVTVDVKVDGLNFAHFDLAALDGDGTYYKAPYSKDSSFVPEPGTLSLLSTGLLGLIPVIRRKKKDVE